MTSARLPSDTPYDAHSRDPKAMIQKYPIETSRLDRSLSILRICSKGPAPITTPNEEAATASTVSRDTV
jgi:hypothetical protein